MRLRLGIALALTASSLALPVVASAATLAPDMLAFDSNRSGNYELYTADVSGAGVTRLTTDPSYDSFWPKISPDRTKILFTRTPAGTHDTDYSKASTWVMDADGSNVTRLLAVGAYGWGIQGHPEWSPDGTKLVMVGGSVPSVQIFITNADATNPVALTGDGAVGTRPGTNIDPSWSPDGAQILFVGCPQSVCTERQYEVYKINVDGTGETRLTNDLYPDYDPYFAPDGRQVAWLRNTGTIIQWAIMRARPDGSNQSVVIDDGGINSKPDWSADGAWIYFHKAPKPFGGSSKFNIWRIRPDGTGLARVLPDHGGAFDNEFPDVVTLGAAGGAPPPSVSCSATRGSTTRGSAGLTAGSSGRTSTPHPVPGTGIRSIPGCSRPATPA